MNDKVKVAQSPPCDAIVIGSGPNGLAAAITLAQHGKSVIVYEAQESIGGGARSAELTLPGFIHDVCSSVYPLAIGSPFFRSLPLAQYDLEWIQPPAAVAHPFDDGTAVTHERSVEATAVQLGSDEQAYRKLMAPLAASWNGLDIDLLGPIRPPRHPLSLARFGLLGIQPARRLAESRFQGERAKGLFAGVAAHSMLPLEHWGSAAFGLVLGIAGHAVGWPIARGGAQKLIDALAAHLRSLGGEIISNTPVRTLDELPSSRVVLCDVTPRQLHEIAGERLSPSYRKSLGRYRYGMGAFKLDWALSGPVPWRAPECTRAVTVHLGGTLEEIAVSEDSAWSGKHVEKPFVRFAPGFRDLIIRRSIMSPLELEKRNANLVGGDINGGAASLGQLFFRQCLQTGDDGREVLEMAHLTALDCRQRNLVRR